MTDITIGGQTIDADDPCAVASALRAIRLRVVAGESVAETMIRDPATQRQVVFTPTNLATLDKAIADYAAMCESARSGTRKRRAIGSGWSR